MSSRTNVRPRPLELSKQLLLVKELSELDPPTEGQKDVLYTVEASLTHLAVSLQALAQPLLQNPYTS